MLSPRTAASVARSLHLTPKRLKFRNQPCEVEGIWFQSKAEARRYCELIILQRAGVIRGLERQPRFDLTVNGVKLGEYRADFSYYSQIQEGGFVTRYVEDVKGVRTPLYAWKKRHMKAEYGIDILEV